jgi:hypothetical protein
MIKANLNDLQEFKKLCLKGHLIIATAYYGGWRNILGFLATFVMNPIQYFKRRKYNNKGKYIGHLFCIFYKNDSLWVGEMDWRDNWKENPIRKSNTFKKLSTGQIRLFDLGATEDETFQTFLQYAKTVKYSFLGAIASEFWFLKLFRSKNNFQKKRHCGSIFVRYEPFFKYFKTTGKNLLRKYGSHHPEFLDHHLKTTFQIKVIEIKKEKIKWN